MIPITIKKGVDPMTNQENFTAPTFEKRVTVRQFLEYHRGCIINMTTPGGFVDLSPEDVEALLEGQSVMAHAGVYDVTTTLSAAELLPQFVYASRLVGNRKYGLLTNF